MINLQKQTIKTKSCHFNKFSISQRLLLIILYKDNNNLVTQSHVSTITQYYHVVAKNLKLRRIANIYLEFVCRLCRLKSNLFPRNGGLLHNVK